MRTFSFNRFDKGMVSDPRDPSEGACRVCSHFDVFTNPHKLSPYRSVETGDSAGSTNGIGNYDYGNNILYGLGANGAGGPARIFSRTTFLDATWTAVKIIGGSALVAADYPAFKFYQNKLFGVRGARYIWCYDVNSDTVYDGSGGNANEADLGASAYTSCAIPLVHPKDDVLYFPYNNKIASKNGTAAWTNAALTLPSSLVITSLAPFGNYLAVACRPTTGTNQNSLKSVLYLWDRNSSLATLSETIEWGEGNLMVLDNIDGTLIGVSYLGDTGSYSFKDRMIVRRYSGSGGAVKVQELIGFSQAPAIATGVFKYKSNNRIFFPACFPVGSTSYTGIWSIGRSTQTGEFGITLDRQYTLGTFSSTSPIFYGLIYLGDYVFASYLDSSSTYFMEKTDDVANYTTTSVLETVINPMEPEHVRGSAGLRSSQKQLKAVAMCFEPLTSGQQVVLKYRVDGGAWTTIGTFTNAVTTETVVAERFRDAAATSFTTGREYEFRFESTGGAEITEFKYQVEVNETIL